MYHLCKPSKPSPQLHQHPRDKFLLSRIVPTNQPPITNKGNVEIAELGIGVTINHKEVTNNQNHLDAKLCYGQINHVNYAMYTHTIHMSIPSWAALGRFFRRKLSAIPML